MKKILMALALACTCAPVLADEVDDFMREHLAATNTPGAAVVMIKGGEIVRAQGFGYANLEHRVPVHVDTIFQSGSIGKMFTAVAVMLMVEDGKLALDTPIRTYLPDAPATWDRITVRHLLTHTSGLGRNYYTYGKVTPGEFDLRLDYSDAQMMQFFYRARIDFPAGQKLSYSNTGYALLGYLVKHVGGVAYGDVLKQRVFRPLNMHTAGQIDDAGIVPNRAAGYTLDSAGQLHNQDWVAPTANATGDGTLYLTVLDFAKWEMAVRERRILKPESWAQILAPARLNSGKTYPYGFGWFLGKHNGHAAQYHSGGWQGFSTFYVRYLEEDTALVALTNRTAGRADEIAVNVARLLDPRLAAPAGAPIAERDPEVTRLVQTILAPANLPASVQGRFETPELHKRVVASYDPFRTTMGALKELKLFGYEEPGDDRTYRYRARFERGFGNVIVTLAADGRINRFTARPADSWDSPLP
ncbi:serine hydrolase domain-containing protein [Luteimonas sp. RIT-PG2_3]